MPPVATGIAIGSALAIAGTGIKLAATGKLSEKEFLLSLGGGALLGGLGGGLMGAGAATGTTAATEVAKDFAVQGGAKAVTGAATQTGAGAVASTGATTAGKTVGGLISTAGVTSSTDLASAIRSAAKTAGAYSLGGAGLQAIGAGLAPGPKTPFNMEEERFKYFRENRGAGLRGTGAKRYFG